MINDNQLNGEMFVCLIKSYTKAINEGFFKYSIEKSKI